MSVVVLTLMSSAEQTSVPHLRCVCKIHTDPPSPFHTQQCCVFYLIQKKKHKKTNHCVSLLLPIYSYVCSIHSSKLDPKGAKPLKKSNSLSLGSYQLPIASHYQVVRIFYSPIENFYFFLPLILNLENLFQLTNVTKLLIIMPFHIFYI